MKNALRLLVCGAALAASVSTATAEIMSEPPSTQSTLPAATEGPFGLKTIPGLKAFSAEEGGKPFSSTAPSAAQQLGAEPDTGGDDCRDLYLDKACGILILN